MHRSQCRRRLPVTVFPGVFLGLFLTGLLVGGCSPDNDPAPVPDAETSPSVATEPEVTVRVTRVAGTLSSDERAALALDAGGVARDYLLGAYVEAPDADPFTDFTEGAAALAEEDRAVLTGETYADGAVVTVDRAAIRLSAVAPQRRVAGATAWVFLNLSVGGAEGADPVPVRVRGRLLLTPSADGWRIFGYDLSRSDVGTVSGEAR